MRGTPPFLALASGGPDDPPDWCFEANPDGRLPTCTYAGGEWHRSVDDPSFGGDGGVPTLFVVGFVLVAVLAVASLVWRISMARGLARAAGMDEDDAATMAVLTDSGLEATYLASTLRPSSERPAAEKPASDRPAAERLQELAGLRDRGLISQEEHDSRRRAILDGI